MILHLQRTFPLDAGEILPKERSLFKDCPVLSVFNLPPSWETAACFEAESTQFQLPGIGCCLQSGVQNIPSQLFPVCN